MTASTPGDWIADLARTFMGEVVTPTDGAYQHARQLHNALVDKRPSVIARCRGAADVVAVVRAARRHQLPLAIRGGGHNVAGLASVDDGVMLDLSPMKGIYVDTARRTARVEGGVLWRELNRATQLHGLATTGGVISTTGVAGLTLGGGLGWLMAQHGLALDNLLSAQVVTAAGEVVHASEGEHADLFWALRGAGANFGVVTSFEFQLHPVGPMIVGGLVAHPLAAAGDVLRFYRDLTRDLPDDIALVAALTHAPDGSGVPIAALAMCELASRPDHSAMAARIKSFGIPVVDAIGPMPYEAVNQMLDSGFPSGTRNYWKSRFVDTLTDDLIDGIVDAFAACPSTMSAIVFEHLHGALTRRPVSATAFPYRSEGYSILALSQWLNPADDERCTKWARDTYQAMKASATTSAYVNYLDADEGVDRIEAAYGTNYARLRKLKGVWDPDNFFRVNQNIPPSVD